MTKEITPEEKARQDAEDQDCDLAKKPHRWQWVWVGKDWTNKRECTRCGKVEHNVSRRNDEQT